MSELTSEPTSETASETARSPTTEPLVEVANLKKYFPIRRGLLKRHVGDIKAVDDVTFTIHRGETLGLVGESGCGKSTTGRSILQLIEPTAGQVRYRGQNLIDTPKDEMRRMRQNLRIIFQDPYASLNPRMTIGSTISSPIRIHGSLNPARSVGDNIEAPMSAQGQGTKDERWETVQDLMTKVGLDPQFANRYPHEFSGGQRQRVGIARALATNPEFIVADEPIAALDVSIQAQIVNLMDDLKTQFGLTYLFIAHDLSMVRYISDRVAVMYLGRIVEIGDCDPLYDGPLHPYTQALISAIPVPDPDRDVDSTRIVLTGDVPSPANPPPGCAFHPRCQHATEICRAERPHLRDLASNGSPHLVACHHAEQFVSVTPSPAAQQRPGSST